jgi:hypothetical protein
MPPESNQSHKELLLVSAAIKPKCNIENTRPTATSAIMVGEKFHYNDLWL